MGLTNDDYLYYKQVFENAGALHRIVSFVNTTENPPVERLLVPDMALTAAEYFAIDKNEKVLVLLTDMTLYADALSIVSNRMDQIPSKDSMPGSLYSDLAKLYEKAVQFEAGGSITIIAVTTLSSGDITHAVPDNTGYITEGQLFLRRDTEIGKVIVDPFRSLSRLKQLVIGKKTREDHPQVMNAAIRLYADAANARTKLENGFDLSDYDERTLEFAREYSNRLLAIDVNIDTEEMLTTALGFVFKIFLSSRSGHQEGVCRSVLGKRLIVVGCELSVETDNTHNPQHTTENGYKISIQQNLAAGHEPAVAHPCAGIAYAQEQGVGVANGGEKIEKRSR
jgi:V/A-type H+/Na+-transporting ATPase subunit B